MARDHLPRNALRVWNLRVHHATLIYYLFSPLLHNAKKKKKTAAAPAKKSHQAVTFTSCGAVVEGDSFLHSPRIIVYTSSFHDLARRRASCARTRAITRSACAPRGCIDIFALFSAISSLFLTMLRLRPQLFGLSPHTCTRISAAHFGGAAALFQHKHHCISAYAASRHLRSSITWPRGYLALVWRPLHCGVATPRRPRLAHGRLACCMLKAARA